MDKKKIQEKARDVAKFTYEVIDDIFGRRILIFAYILAAIFAASVIFQVFTKYIYEDGFSTAERCRIHSQEGGNRSSGSM